jgi:AcrR family transcriptional regulator
LRRDIKKAIIDATIKLINEKGSNPDAITVRDICKEADVSISLINYHFQTKDNLIAECVQKIIGTVITGREPWSDALPGKTLLETLKIAMNATMTFMYSVENISRISILTDHQNPRQGDNTFQAMNAFYPLVIALCSEKNIPTPRKMLNLLIQSIQGIFLRTEVLREDLKVDLRNDEERKAFVDDMVDILFR